MGKLETIPAWDLTKVRSKKQVIDEARTSGAKVHFSSLMDICHLKDAELEAKRQKYKGRVVLRGDVVKDDSGSYAAFTEQRSSASQMTAAKVMDIISRLPGCDGRSIRLYPSENGRCSQIVQNSKIGVYRHSDTSTQTQKGPNHGPVWKTRSFLSKELWTVTLWQVYCGKGNVRKFFWNTVGKSFKLRMLICQPSKRTILSVYVDDSRLPGKTEH